MTPAKRLVQWGKPSRHGRSELVSRSLCQRYELIESPSAKGATLYSVVLNPDRRGTYEFRVLFVERSKADALSKLEAFEAERAAALVEPTRKAA